MVIRFKLFFFFTTMAWASVFKPEYGKEMIDAAHVGVGEGPVQW